MPHPLTRSEQIESVARGRPGAAERSFGARVKWIPTINGIPVSRGNDEDEWFDLEEDALADAARRCRGPVREVA
jgi:hypothetical protein